MFLSSLDQQAIVELSSSIVANVVLTGPLVFVYLVIIFGACPGLFRNSFSINSYDFREVHNPEKDSALVDLLHFVAFESVLYTFFHHMRVFHLVQLWFGCCILDWNVILPGEIPDRLQPAVCRQVCQGSVVFFENMSW